MSCVSFVPTEGSISWLVPMKMCPGILATTNTQVWCWEGLFYRRKITVPIAFKYHLEYISPRLSQSTEQTRSPRPHQKFFLLCWGWLVLPTVCRGTQPHAPSKRCTPHLSFIQLLKYCTGEKWPFFPFLDSSPELWFLYLLIPNTSTWMFSGLFLSKLTRQNPWSLLWKQLFFSFASLINGRSVSCPGQHMVYPWLLSSHANPNIRTTAGSSWRMYSLLATSHSCRFRLATLSSLLPLDDGNHL